ncbi:MAG: hypothetical protein ABI045_04410 [Flavobacteriales bacterium]
MHRYTQPLNYWWIILCSLDWGAGILQEDQELDMFLIAALGFYPLCIETVGRSRYTKASSKQGLNFIDIMVR